MTGIVQATRERSRRWLALPMAAVVLVTLVLVQGASSQRLTVVTTCGQSVTGNVLLANDLTCSGDGIVVAGDGTTVNLNGHKISGPTGLSEAIGVYGQHFKSVTVKNGTISGFNNGVEFDSFSSATVQGMRVSGSASSGIVSVGNALITGNTVLQNTNGIFLFGGGKATITNNVAYGNNGPDS